MFLVNFCMPFVCSCSVEENSVQTKSTWGSLFSLLPCVFLCSGQKFVQLELWRLKWVDSVFPSEASRMWNLPCPDLPCTKVIFLIHCPSSHKHTYCLLLPLGALLIILDFLLKPVSCCPVLVTLFCSRLNTILLPHHHFSHALDNTLMLPIMF